MSEMVERVAKAMFEFVYTGRSWDNDYDCYAKDSWRKGARQVIAAMREPTLAMCEAAEQFATGENPRLFTSPPTTWRDMIDAALQTSD